MRYLLDTCVISEYTKPAPSDLVMTWLQQQDEDSLYICVITIGELDKGISRLANSRRKKQLEEFLDRTINRFDRRILDVDTPTIRKWANLAARLESKGKTMPLMDALIASTALQNDLTLVTRNTADFVNTGVDILNIWAA